jgi:predicted nuclease of restriction endonuclease-like (RecB) superfamily
VNNQNFSLIPENYDQFLRSLKERIRIAQVRASLAVNSELVLLYWHIGQSILERQRNEGWGAKIIETIARDLKKEFPNSQGWSARNLKYMKAFADAYPDIEIVQRSVALLPWRHNIALLEKLSLVDERAWYAQQAIENGWSRDVLVLQIESKLRNRLGSATTNFSQVLPKPQSDLAQSLLKDPYNLEFLTLSRDAQERDLEAALVHHIRDFLLELGVGFSFMGSQYGIEVDGKEYRMDLLFYHVKLRCYIIVDLKMGEFQPEFSGKMNFYVSAVDALFRHADDNPTIGLILCKSKSKTTVEYALRNVSTPIGVSTHQLPESLEDSLPSVEQLEMELQSAIADIEKVEEESE